MLDLMQLTRLPGAADENFEVLTRTIVTRRYGRYGRLRERRNQPGVEFYLEVLYPGPLGDPGRVWGWSCKWFILNRDNEFTAAQRTKIKESLEKAIAHVAGLTDFVLCLPQRPAKKEEEWIAGLAAAVGSSVTTRLWAAEDYETELAGHDELRATFFGELALTPDTLARTHERSVAPVKERWQPHLHTRTHVESRIDRVLLRPASFDVLEARAEAIAARSRSLRAARPGIGDEQLRATAEHTANDMDEFVEGLRLIVDAGRSQRPTEVRERVATQQPPATSRRALRLLVLALRKRRLPAAPMASGLGADIQGAVSWLQEVHADAEAPLIAVVAAAGQGKTHLAAHLTSPTGSPTAGVYIQGTHLQARGTLDDLARRVPGLRVERFDELLEALNSAGARAGARVPLIIDGLNEAERPSQWRGLLEGLVPALGDYPHVAVILTLRHALAGHAVPDGATSIELEWQQGEVTDIVRAYFAHYLINAADAWLPTGLFHNPLFVRMYCEAANHDRQKPVGAEALPTSLVGVFERYRDVVAQRLSHDPARAAIPVEQIKRRLAALAQELWTRGTRRIPSERAREIIDAGVGNWDESLFRRLIEEGVLLREEVPGDDDTETGFLFDRFAGYLIADALLVRMTYTEVDERLAHGELWKSLLGGEAHPLGEDVAVGLVGLVPRRFTAHHLWPCAPAAYRSWALKLELEAESEFLDDATVDALRALVIARAPASPGPLFLRSDPFDRLWEVRSSPAHRLNADFLDRALRQLPLAERDWKWTEWVRHRASDLLLDDLNRMTERWNRTPTRTESDDLDALAVAWLLASTHRQLRDLATKALQRYGRPEPRRLFDVAARMLDVDDPYIVERILGAAFGAATTHQMPDPDGPLERAVSDWLVVLRERFLTGGSSPTTHELLRGYVRAMYEYAGTIHPAAIPADIDPFTLKFAAVQPAPIMAEDDPNAAECNRTFGMDFENYVIGSIIKGRGNYDSHHPDYRRSRGEVMARVWDLGWRAAQLGDIDRAIAERSPLNRGRGRVERYGKKYGWIAYYELTGRLADSASLPERWEAGGRHVTPDIDPTFPDEPAAAPLQLPQWAPQSPTDDRIWLRTGAVDVPSELWSPETVYGVAGGWLLVEGFLEHRRDGRKVFGFFRTVLLEREDADTAVELAGHIEYPGNHFFPELPPVREVFAGEMPWSPRFEPDPDDGEPDSARPALRQDWRAKGIAVGQLAVGFSTSDGALTELNSAYDVPSFEFAQRFGLRQLPGTLDLVGLDGVRASAAFSVPEPWRGYLLFIRRDLVTAFAGSRRVMQAAWGEREVTVESYAAPAWVHAAHQEYEHIWRHIRLL